MSLKYGDLVTFDGSTDNPFDAGIDKKELILGRLHGKFKTISVAQSFSWVPNSSRSDLYIFAPEPAVDMDFDFFNGDPEGFVDMDFEWGSYPKVNWFLATESNISSAVSDELACDFKIRGLCVRCGSPGEWRQMAAFCKYHGRIL